ncbi:class I SAM-dependent methyltransferase [Paenibacillus antibioticophila]|uniref:class I SAM-dependent methyltransferase n=1 Tax=Paenibacillus antibioticophila TaxID=1274374 RepID=UPI0005C9170C|nr:methyltransferase [Paenibacillus antibioticophila]
MNIHEHLLFLQAFLNNPKRVGSLLPSSRYLATKIVQFVPWDEVKSVAELGSGTGVITQLIKTQLTDSNNVFLFERDKKLRESLKVKYPDYMFHSNASYLIKKMKQENINQLDCIICGLPFFNFSSKMRTHILDQIVKALKPGGILVAYQYSLQMKKKYANHLIIEKIEFIPYSFPPTFVYVCRKSYFHKN